MNKTLSSPTTIVTMVKLYSRGGGRRKLQCAPNAVDLSEKGEGSLTKNIGTGELFKKQHERMITTKNRCHGGL